MSRRRSKGRQSGRGRGKGRTGGHGSGRGRSSQRRSRDSSRTSQRILIGKVQKNPRGFAFLIPEDPKVEDAYVPPEEALILLHGDKVAFRVERRGPRRIARIQSIVERATREIFGFVVEGGDERLIQTEEGDLHRLSHPLPSSRVGDWVVARIDKYPTRRKPTQVSVVENFGRQLKPAHDIRIAAGRFGLPTEFPEEVSLEAALCRKKAREVAEDPPSYRKDLRHLPFVTIDGEDAKDFDDAVLVLKEHEGSPFVLFVAIADVSFFVEAGGVIDKEALNRSTSVYFPGVCIPMLPEALSNDVCSLRPREDKLAFTAEIHFDKDGRATRADFYESLIRTDARLTYTQVQKFFDEPASATEELRALSSHVKALRQLYRKLAQQRTARGVLDFDLPEAQLEVDKEGTPLDSRRAPRYESHKLIEEFMIAANTAVARALRENGVPALYRVHEPPDPRSLEEINHLLRGLGITQPVRDLTPKAIGKVLQQTHGLKGAGALHQAILRLQKQAHYEPEPKGHFGLALSDYTHFTSPIRRYPDLVVHRSLKGLIARRRPADKAIRGTAGLDAVGQHTSERERRAMDAERFVVRRKQCWFMMKHIGEEFSGLVAGALAKGMFVEIPRYGIEGFVPIERLDGDYTFDEGRMCLQRRPGHKVYAIGDEVAIRVENVSVEEGQITFGLANS